MAKPLSRKLQKLQKLETERTKVCIKCHKILPLYDFTLRADGRKFAVSHCKKCERERSYKRYYNSTIEQYVELLEQQNNKCAICGTVKPGGVHKTFFLVDHDHKTDKVRGLLCHNCNSGLGHFKDNPEFLASAIAYILKQKDK